MPNELMCVSRDDWFSVAAHKKEPVGDLHAVDLAFVGLPRIALGAVVVDEWVGTCLDERDDIAGACILELLSAWQYPLKPSSVIDANVRRPTGLDRENL